MKDFKPFECPIVMDRIKEEREELLASLSRFDMPDSERQFIIRKINHMSERLVRAGRYAKDSNEN